MADETVLECGNCGAEVYTFAIVDDPTLAVFVNDVDMSGKSLCFGCAHGDVVRLPIAIPEIAEPMKKLLSSHGVKGLKPAPESQEQRRERRKYEAAMRRWNDDVDRAKRAFEERLRDPEFRASLDLPAELPESAIQILKDTLAWDQRMPDMPTMPEFMQQDGGSRGVERRRVS